MGRYPWVEYFLFETLYFVLFYPTSHHTHRAVVLSGMIYLATQIYRTSEVTDPLITTYTLGSVIAFHFAFIVYLFCAEGSFPDHWRRVRDEVHTKTAANDSDNPPSNFPPLKKFWWMLDITYNPRVIGWVQEPRSHLPQHPPPSPQTFFWKTLLKIIYNVIVADLAASVFTGSSAFDSRAHDPADGPETYLAAVPLPRRMPYVLAFGARMASSFHVLHGILSLVCVVFGRSSPTLWPDLWGRWSDAYTIRRFWGQTWHQLMRPAFVGLGRLVANKFLKFPRGTSRSSYTQLYLAFFLSGIIHFAGDFMHERRMVYHSFKFFILQAVAITFEDLVIYTTKPLRQWGGIGLKPGKADESWGEAAVKVIGYCWVVLWFCLALPVWVDGTSVAGIYDTDRGPIAQFVWDTWKKWA